MSGSTSEFGKISRNRPDLAFEPLPDLRYHYRKYLPPIAHIRTDGHKKPGFLFCNDFMKTIRCEKSHKLEKYIHNKGHPFIRFDYIDHGDSLFKLKTANEPIDDKTPILSPFPGPRPLQNDRKLLDFKLWIEDITTLLEEFTDGPQILVGEGFGAWMALLVAMERADKVKGVICLSTGVDMMGRYINQIFKTKDKERIQAGEVIWYQDHPDGPFVGSKKLVEDSKPFHLLNRKGKLPIRCPVRLVHCYSDTFIPHTWAMRLAEKLQSQDVEIYLKKTGDHKMTTESDYDLTYKAIDSMLSLF